ncbi:unnamed protein product [Urochloa humidicola]
MDMVGGSAQTAVDSLLGRLSSVLVEEAQLLRNVHGDMQFIKREMESMNGFLLDAADDGRGDSNQVRAWKRQVHELAFDSQSCVDRYVHTFGATHPAAGAGLLASFGWVPELLRTLPTRHRIAAEIREVKARALEVGERRLRYGVVVPPERKAVEAGSSTVAARRRAAIANQEAEDARRRAALDSSKALFDANERAKELVTWLMGEPPAVPRGLLRRNQLVTAGQLMKKLVTGRGGANDRDDLVMELMKLIRGLSDNDDPENVVEAAGYLREAMREVGKQEVKVISSWLLDKVLGRADMLEDPNSHGPGVLHELLVDVHKALRGPMHKFLEDADELGPYTPYKIKDVICDLLDMFKALKKPMKKFLGLAYAHSSESESESEDEEMKKQDGSSLAQRHAHAAAAANEDLLKMVKAAKEPMEVARAEARYVAAQLWWLCWVFFSSEEDEHHPKVVAIVTPPVDDMSNDDDRPGEQQPLEETHATDLAKKVYNHPSTSKHFSTKVWVDAKQDSKLKKRLLSIHKQLQDQEQQQQDNDEKKPAEWSVDKLKTKIAQRLKGKRFLIVLADPEDNNAWQDITSALPEHGDGAVMVTPRIKYMPQFHGWYTASWFFLLTGASSRYHVHFCSNLVGMRKVAAQLVGGSGGDQQLPAGVSAVLKKCLWDSFATKMFLHALYANPHRSDAELERLVLGLRYASSVSNARRIVHFCYEDLPRQYQSCLLSLSVFPPLQQGNGGRTKLKRTSLVRRWAAENFVSARDGLAAVDEADRCFDALVARGLLEPADIGPAGKVKSCTLDPRVLSFITKMASRDALITDGKDLPPNMAHHLSTSGVILQRLMEDQSAADSNTCWGSMIHRRRRLTEAGQGDSSSRQDDDGVVTFLTSLPASSDQLGLVKLLDLEGCKGLTKRRLKKICNKIFQLKYLSLRNTDAVELPKEINRLRYLETLDIRETVIPSFPANTIALPKLMHLLAGRTAATGSPDDKSFSTVHLPSGIASMTNMQVMSHVEVSKNDEGEFRNVGRKLHLRKLGVVIRGDGEEPLTVFLRVVGMLHETLCSLSVHLQPAVHSEGGDARSRRSTEARNDGGGHPFTINATEIPKSLESLNINGKVNELPAWVKQLHRLSKITLCRTSLRGEDLHRLGELANLRCIRLLHQSYAEQMLTFNTREFKKLEILVIEDSGISDVHFAEDAAPTFTRKDITLSGINMLLNLKEVRLNGHCDDSTTLSKIKQDLHENRNLPKLFFNSTN